MTRKLSLIIKIHQFVVLWIREIILLTLYLNFSQFRMDYGRIYWLGIILNQSKSLILVKNLKEIGLCHVSELKSGLNFQIQRFRKGSISKWNIVTSRELYN